MHPKTGNRESRCPGVASANHTSHEFLGCGSRDGSCDQFVIPMLDVNMYKYQGKYSAYEETIRGIIHGCGKFCELGWYRYLRM